MRFRRHAGWLRRRECNRRRRRNRTNHKPRQPAANISVVLRSHVHSTNDAARRQRAGKEIDAHSSSMELPGLQARFPAKRLRASDRRGREVTRRRKGGEEPNTWAWHPFSYAHYRPRDQDWLLEQPAAKTDPIPRRARETGPMSGKGERKLYLNDLIADASSSFTSKTV